MLVELGMRPVYQLDDITLRDNFSGDLAHLNARLRLRACSVHDLVNVERILVVGLVFWDRMIPIQEVTVRFINGLGYLH